MSKWPLALLLSLLATLAAGAAENESPTQPPSGPDASISSSDATAIVRQAYAGRVVSVTKGERDIGGVEVPGYWVRVDVDGRIKKVFVDSRGRIHEDE